MRTLLVGLFLVIGSFCIAQPGPPDPPAGGPPPGGGPGNGGRPAPLSGIELLIAAGAAFGAQRFLKRNKKSE